MNFGVVHVYYGMHVYVMCLWNNFRQLMLQVVTRPDVLGDSCIHV